jgi:hypothetical protein
MTRVAQDGKQALQEAERREVVEVAFMPAALLAAAATLGWPPIQAIKDCAVAWSPPRAAFR